MLSLEQQEYIESILGNEPARQGQKYLQDAAYASLRRDILAKLLHEFDLFCNEHDVRYFLFTATLLGAHVYQDYIPGEKSIKVGMLPTDFDKLANLLPNGKKMKDGAVAWALQTDGDGSERVKNRLNPTVRAYTCEPVLIDGVEQFESDSLSLMVENPSFNISIFYSVPDDFFTMRHFYDRIDKVNEQATELDKSIGGEHGGNSSSSSQDRDKFVDDARKLARSYEEANTKCCARLLGSRSNVMPKEALANRRRVMFHGVETWAPGEGNPWTKDPIVGETPDDLKNLQRYALEIAQEIHRICKELGIGYFACGGTMLGYVRHGGFIPWDDDIDVGMLRADYERFLVEAPALLDAERFFLQTAESDPEAPYLFSKIRRNGTVYITKYNQYRDFHKGICVDIFPFDEIPNSASKQAAMLKRARKCSKNFGEVINQRFGERQVSINEGRKTLDYFVAHMVEGSKWRKARQVSLPDLRAEYDETVTAYSHSKKKDKCRYVASFVPTFTMIRKEDLLPYREVDFEGIKLNMPAKPEVFLSMQYGDYMTLPPLHQRVGHNLLEMGEAPKDPEHAPEG